MADVTSAIEKSIDNSDNDSARLYFSSVDSRDHKVIWRFKCFSDILLLTFFFTSCHRNLIATWKFKCFETSHKQFFILVLIMVKGLYEE